MLLKRSEDGKGEYYQLIDNKIKSINYLKKIIRLPYSLFQYLIKAPIAYFLVEPLFQKDEEKNTTVLEKKVKYPDPMLKDGNEIVILNVVPRKNYLHRLWRKLVFNFFSILANAPILKILFRQKLKFTPVYVPSHLDKIIREVDLLITPVKEDAKIWCCNQIQFKGLEFLTTDERNYFFDRLQAKYHYNFKTNKNNYNFYTLQTITGQTLDSVEVRGPTVMDQAISERKFIVYCLFRRQNFQDWIPQYRYYADELNATIVGFNYRGNGLSKGFLFDPHDMHDDIIAQVDRLIAIGTKPENIGLMGECFGANIAIQAAASLHERGDKVKLFTGRSFRSLPLLFLGQIEPSKEAPPLHPKTLVQKFISFIVRFIFVPFLRFMKWDMEADQAFLSIPPKDRDFFTVRSQKDPIDNARFKDDMVINHRTASTYSLVKKEQQRILEKQSHGEPITENENEWLKDNLKSHQVYVSPELRQDAKITDGHASHFRYLIQTHPERKDFPVDARDYAIGFFRKAGFASPDKLNQENLYNVSYG